MKELYFVGNSLDELRAFPTDAKREAGFQLDRVQNELNPNDWKTMKTIGARVREIRIRCAACLSEENTENATPCY